MLYDNLRKIEPYVPGEQPKFKNIIKLNTNENPYPPSKNVIEAIKNFDGNSLRLYPDPDIKELSDVWANYINESYEGMNINSDNVFIGVGSDDVLSVAFQTFFNSGKPVLFPNITYSFYDVWCDVYNIPYKTIPLKNDFTINADGYNIANGGIVIANPNAPTGIELSKDYIKKILDNNRDVVVIVDEAYVDFGGESMIPLINEYENLVVVQTFSKSRSMAGARLGGAFADKRLIKAMKDVKFSINSYTISNLFIKAGIASIEDDEYFKTQVGKNS